MKKILIINGHPNSESYNDALAEAYKRGALAKGYEVVQINVRELKFDLNLNNGYSKSEELESDVILAQKKIKWADHIVIIHPLWWGSIPALLKGFFDRVLLPDFAFKYKTNSPMWDKLLQGRSGRVIYTLDYPLWYYRFVLKAPSEKQIKKMTLEFCGIKPVVITAIGPIRKSTDEFRKNWLLKIETLGNNAA